MTSLQRTVDSSRRRRPARTQHERKADTRRRLLAAAADLFAEHGVDAVSVDTVAEAAGRTSGAVYDHFGSKQGLVLAVLDDWKQSLVTVVLAEFEVAADVAERLRAVAVNLVVHPSEETRRGRLLEQELWRRARRDTEVAAVLRERTREARQWMARGFAAWIDQGLIAPVADPVDLAVAFRAAVDGLTVLHDLDPEVLDVEAATAALVAVLKAPTIQASADIAGEPATPAGVAATPATPAGVAATPATPATPRAAAPTNHPPPH